MLAENAFDQHPHSGPRRFPVLPIHGCAAFQAAQEFMGDDTEVVVAHHLDRTLVLGQGIVEGDLLLGSAPAERRIARSLRIRSTRDGSAQYGSLIVLP